jgi:hypothetical protein
LRELPLCVVQQLVADVHFEVDAVEVGHVCLSPEVVSQVDLRLLGCGPVLAELPSIYISWIFRR